MTKLYNWYPDECVEQDQEHITEMLESLQLQSHEDLITTLMEEYSISREEAVDYLR